MRITLPPLHVGQREVADHPARFKVLACGRRWGKTRLGTLVCFDVALKGGRTWWVAPSYSIAEVGWRGAKQLAEQIPESNVKEKDKLITFPKIGPDAAIQVRSADNPDSLRGDGLDLAVVDESAFVEKRAWYESLRPALSDKLGGAYLVGTPKGRNWFFDEFSKGRDPLNTEYASWNLPSNSNPFFPPDEWEAAKRQLPSDVFRQEYEAEFLEDSAGVFRRIENILRDSEGATGPFIVGADIAKIQDYTVLIAMCRKTGQCTAMERFQCPYPLMRERIQTFSKDWGNARVYLDATTYGDPVADDLKVAGVNLSPVKISLPTKVAMIQKLSVDIEKESISFPKSWEVVTDELRRYEYRISPRGTLHYSAPEGYHDDCVIALALANWGRRRAKTWVA